MTERLLSIQNVMDPERRLMSASLLCAIRDSVYYHPEVNSKITNPNTRKSRYYRKLHADNNRQEARDWIRAGSLVTTDTTMGFGHVWETLRQLGSVHWSLPLFIDEMEKLWAATDKANALGSRVIEIIHGIQIETTARTVIDRVLAFDEIRSAA